MRAKLLSSRGHVEFETRHGCASANGEVVLTKNALLVVARRGFRRERKVIFSIPLWSVMSVEETGWLRKRLLLTVATPDSVTRRIWLEVDNVRSWLATLKALVREPPL